MKKFALLVLASFALCGCWDKIELENRGFAVSIGIDCGKQDDGRYAISIAMPDIASLANKEGEATESVSLASGDTVSSAMQTINSRSDKAMYFGLTKLAVFGKEALSDPELFREAADALERNAEFGRKLIVLATDGAAKDILDARVPGEPITGVYVSDYYKNNPDMYVQDLGSMTRRLRFDGCALIPKITAGSDKKELKFGGAAVIKDFKLAGWLDGTQMRGYQYIIRNMRGTRLTAGLDNHRTAFRIDKSGAEIRFPTNNSCEINVKVTGAIEEYSFQNIGGGDSLTARIRELSEKYEKKIADDILASANKFRELGVDGFGLKEAMRKKNNAAYKTLEAQGFDFSAFEIKLNVNVEITGTGALR